MNELARKDLFFCLGIWLALEVICFAILPALHLIQPRTTLQSWFLMSLLLGIGGAVLIAGSTQLTGFLQLENSTGIGKLFQSWFTLLVSWLGLLGIGFPLLVMSLQLFSKIFGVLKT